jgi:hypothetical protein
VPDNGLVEDIIFENEDFFRVKPKIYDRAMMALVHRFLLEASFWRSWTSDAVLVVLELLF